jgi:hypothetical protein
MLVPKGIVKKQPLMPTPELKTVLLNARNHWNLWVRSYVNMRLEGSNTAGDDYMAEVRKKIFDGTVSEEENRVG